MPTAIPTVECETVVRAVDQAGQKPIDRAATIEDLVCTLREAADPAWLAGLGPRGRERRRCRDGGHGSRAHPWRHAANLAEQIGRCSRGAEQLGDEAQEVLTVDPIARSDEVPFGRPPNQVTGDPGVTRDEGIELLTGRRRLAEPRSGGDIGFALGSCPSFDGGS